MKKFLSLLALLPRLLSAESSISSDKASYDGNHLILRGSVQLKHILGIMESGVARLNKEDKDAPFSHIHLKNDVLITLNNRGKISCDEAFLDFVNLQGTLIPKKGKKVLFSRLSAKTLNLSSKEAQIYLEKSGEEYDISKIEATRDVHVQYNKDFCLDADTAVFQNGTMPCICASNHCYLSHFEDHIKADKIKLFPDTSTVVLKAPKGHFTPSPFTASGSVFFNCNEMIWDHAPQRLTLKGDIQVHDESLGTISSDDEIELYQKEVEGKWVISSLFGKGKTIFACSFKDGIRHLLISTGTFRLNHDRLNVTLESAPDKPIEYIQDKMKLCADLAKLDYTQEEKRISPKKLLLTKEVRLTDEESSRCALADQFVYLPEEKKMILSSTSGQNVLFWDHGQDLSISASEVHITATAKGEKIKGIGHVRFAFSSTENDLLKKLFPFYKPQTYSTNLNRCLSTNGRSR